MRKKAKTFYAFIVFIDLFCLIVFFSSCAHFSYAAPEPQKISAEYFGIIPNASDEREFAYLDALGITWLRDTFYWSSIEREMGTWTFSAYDTFVEESNAAGKKILAILAYDTAWLYGEDKRRSYITQEKLPLYLRYVEEVVTRYKGKIAAWEIWNEPNWIFWKGAREDFYELSRAAAEKIRELDPDAVIVAGSFNRVPVKFIREMFAAGAMENVDVVSFHPYDINPRFSVQLYDKIEKLLSELDYSGRIWVTEVGYPTGGFYPTKIPESGLPKFLVKTMTGLAVRGAEISFWYKLCDRYNRDDPRDLFDSERYFGIAYPDYSPKKGAASYALCARYLAGTEYRPDLPLRKNLPKMAETLYFRGENGENTLILWNNGEAPLSVRAVLPGTGHTIHDIVSGEGKSFDREIKLSLNGDPKFLTWKSSGLPPAGEKGAADEMPKVIRIGP
ncbi:MAG: endo-1,4-beta-xylanase [Treponema sp.]|jgi:hypothetical protein|nr:endo-1,4-beta-xylanase [Treponema sp.]